MEGTKYNDKVTGTVHDDSIDVLSGSDEVEAKGGNDFIVGGEGSDKLAGNEGADTIFGDVQYGDDTPSEPTADNSWGTAQSVYEYTASADKTETVTHSVRLGNYLVDNSGSINAKFTLIESYAAIYIELTDSNGNVVDKVPANISGTGEVSLDYTYSNQKFGDDQLITFNLVDNSGNTITDISSVEIIANHIYDDTIEGGDGDDTIFGQQGEDTIYGGKGNDFLDGDINNDTIHGGDDNDVIIGGDGNETLYGDAGADTLLGSDGNDIIYGGEGDDLLLGELGDDKLDGGDRKSVV